MKTFSIFILTLLFYSFNATGQEFNKSINKDSLLKAVLKDLPESRKKEFLETYNSGNDQAKEFLLFMLSMPRSSKKEMIKNINQNYEKINTLKKEYAKLVPADYTVSIEFKPGNKIVSTKESIDLRITHLKDGETTVTQDWNLDYNSEKLDTMLSMLKWTKQTLAVIKKLLIDARCVSIENGRPAEIGFARSGMGKYSYLLFDSNLTADQVKKYNDGCICIFYKKNIVLEYGGGAIGPQCFPDK